ncbi:DUF6415 family natural product biosynthesis protein [Streptomyces sp. NPDC001890]|uniref:DUF6415 family natural product biosynthesis protein n=1 Tax=Streptomyces sp. NPDC001890 TaxID=3364620 RepID=UPI0036B306EF
MTRAGRGRGKRPARDAVAAATETVTLVLSNDASALASVQDVEDLAKQLRGHITQLGAVVHAGHPILRAAWTLGVTGLPHGYEPSRRHLRDLALATENLIQAVRSQAAHGDTPGRLRRNRRSGPLHRHVTAPFTTAVARMTASASPPRH